MNLSNLEGDILGQPKPWLNIVANSISTFQGSYMNGGFPVSFQNLSQVTDEEVKNTTVNTSIIDPLELPPNYGDMKFPILSSGMQIMSTIAFILQMTSVGLGFRFSVYLNGHEINFFIINAAIALPNTGLITAWHTYDDVGHELKSFIHVSFSNSTQALFISTTAYISGAVNDFDFRVEFNQAAATNSFNAKSITSQALGLFNS